MKKQLKQENRSVGDSTKKNPKQKMYYSKFSTRVKALITDMFMIYMPILYSITYIILNGKEDFQDSQLAPFFGVMIYALIYAILISKFGQTPGKRAYDIKVVDDKTGNNISFFRALYRFFVFLFSATIVVGLLLPLFRKDKKSLHDIICGTFVAKIEDDRKKDLNSSP